MPLLRQLPIKLGVENHNVHRVDEWIDSLMLKGIRNFEDLVMCDRLLELSRECRVPFEVSAFFLWNRFGLFSTFIPRLGSQFLDQMDQIQLFSQSCFTVR